MNTTSRRSFMKGVFPAMAVAGVAGTAIAVPTYEKSALTWKVLKPLVKEQIKTFAKDIMYLPHDNMDKIRDALHSMAFSTLSPLWRQGIIHDFKVYNRTEPSQGCIPAISIGVKETSEDEFTIWTLVYLDTNPTDKNEVEIRT